MQVRGKEGVCPGGVGSLWAAALNSTNWKRPPGGRGGSDRAPSRGERSGTSGAENVCSCKQLAAECRPLPGLGRAGLAAAAGWRRGRPLPAGRGGRGVGGSLECSGRGAGVQVALDHPSPLGYPAPTYTASACPRPARKISLFIQNMSVPTLCQAPVRGEHAPVLADLRFPRWEKRSAKQDFRSGP